MFFMQIYNLINLIDFQLYAYIPVASMKIWRDKCMSAFPTQVWQPSSISSTSTTSDTVENTKDTPSKDTPSKALVVAGLNALSCYVIFHVKSVFTVRLNITSSFVAFANLHRTRLFAVCRLFADPACSIHLTKV